MRMQRGSRGQFSSLYGTTTLRLGPEFAYPPLGPRYERLVFATDGQLIVPLNEWYHLMKGVGAARTRETYLAVLRPWFGFLAEHGYPWNARPEAVREYTRLFLLDAGCALRTGRIEGWFVQATNRSPIKRQRTALVDWGAALSTPSCDGVSSIQRISATTRCTRSSIRCTQGPGRLAIGASQVDPQCWGTGVRGHPFSIVYFGESERSFWLMPNTHFG
jgi:hypothetical protein